jgi:hypothetical protein
MKTCTLILIGVILSLVSPGLAMSYYTTFSADQNPLSENGNWVDGTITGQNTDCAITNNCAGLHYAYGLQSGTNGYDDSLAVLAGTNWGPTQSLTLTIYCTNQLPSSADVYEEVEYGLQCTLSNNWFSGYFMDCSLNSDSSYVELGLYYGPGGANVNWGADVYDLPPVTNGSTICAAITNGTITIAVNGQVVIQSTDPTGISIPTGAPCIGFFHQNMDGVQTDFGISSFYATDGNDPPGPCLSPLLTNGQFGFAFQAALNQSYLIQENTNPATTNWCTLTNFPGEGLPYQFILPASNPPPWLFFRIAEP